MNFSIDKTNRNPSYLQLYQMIRNEITSGSFSFGDKLPSKRIISEESELSLITIEHALDILIAEGYIEPIERKGYFVCYTKDNNLPVNEKKIIHQKKPILNDTSFPITVISKTMRKIITEYEEDILQKSPNNGLLELRVALVNYLQRSRGIHILPEQIIIGSGTEYFYSLLVQLLGRNRIFGVEDPSYEKIRKMYRANGVKIDKLKMGANGIFTSELQRTPASVLHITPYNSYPSGITADASKRVEYINWAINNDSYIIEDDYDSEFSVSSKAVDTLFSLEPESHVIYMNTFTKTISSSIRVSYMILPKKLLKSAEERIGFYSCTVSTFQQLVIAELINNGSFERHINRMRRSIRNKMSER